MKNIIEELYDSYNRFEPNANALLEIEEAHQMLIRSLEKPERKLVLRIIDNKDLIAGAKTRESFECGFWLAWRLLTQLNIYDNGRLLEVSLNTGGRFFMPKGSDENEQTD